MTDAVRVIGVPTDYGTSRRGVDMGPSAIRYAGLLDQLTRVNVRCDDAGDLAVPRVINWDSGHERPDAKALDLVGDVSRDLADSVAASLREGSRPLILGGDHSIAIGSLTGSARDASIGVVWFDAHSDFNTPETTPSGNVHGMPLAAVLGRGEFAEMPWARATGLQEENVAIVGLRDVDDEERTAIATSEMTAFTMSDIDERGIASVVGEALDVATDGVDGLHVSLDMDWLDPVEAPGVGTPVRGGVTYREAHSSMEYVAQTGQLRSMELVEVNPILDQHNETAELATELAASAFGKRII